MSGGRGKDTFVVTQENAGATDTILDFAPGAKGDRLDLEVLLDLHTLADVTGHMTEVAGHVQLDLAQAGGGSVIFENVAAIGAFKAANFQLAPDAVASEADPATAPALHGGAGPSIAALVDHPSAVQDAVA